MSLVVPGLIVGTVAISTALIMANKLILSEYKFGCPTFLTAFHFILSWFLLRLMISFKFLEQSLNFPNLEAWKIALFGVGGIALMNWNLKVNSIGFYQLSKLCTIPYMVAFKFIVRHEHTSLKLCSALLVLLIGLALFTVNDVEVSIVGTVLAIFAVVSTAQAQIMISSVQRDYRIGATQLNYEIMPRQFMICLISALFVETSGTHDIRQQDWQFRIFAGFLGTGLLAVAGNIIGYSIMGKLGPITWQVVGHVKTMLIFVIGLIMFPTQEESAEQRTKKIGGLVAAMGGVILYTVFEMQAKAEEAKKAENRRILADDDLDHK
jgi:solute carrier family 35 protein E3